MTSQPHITELRQHLMDTLADLRDRKNPMEPDRARAVAQVASVLIDTAKVENEYLRLSGQDRSVFLGQQDSTLRIVNTKPTANNPFPVSVRHQLEG